MPISSLEIDDRYLKYCSDAEFQFACVCSNQQATWCDRFCVWVSSSAYLVIFSSTINSTDKSAKAATILGTGIVVPKVVGCTKLGTEIPGRFTRWHNNSNCDVPLLNNKEKCLNSVHEWCLLNTHRKSIIDKAWREQNKQRVYSNKKAWRELNRNKENNLNKIKYNYGINKTY